MIKHLFLCFALLLGGSTGAVTQKRSTAIENYIRQYSKLAVWHQEKYGIPASITLAQGILESGAGLSSLARNANNHFGIKCHSTWKGASVRHDDDKKNECFRKYKTVEESYQDHSDFLKTGSRYDGLFKLKQTDYARWAKGLQVAGYATDRAYANSLIKIIEDYKLYQYDSAKTTDIGKKEKEVKEKKEVKEQVSRPKDVPVVKRAVSKSQGLSFIYALANDDIDRIASETAVSVKDLRKFNEIPEDFPIQEGDIIYLGKKKKKAEKPNYDHVVQIGESMHSISQKYGLQVKSLYKLNRKKAEYVPVEGDVLKLR